MTKELAIKIRDALKGGKNIPLRIMFMDGPVVIMNEADTFAYTKWDDANGIIYYWRLLNPNDHQQAGSNLAQAVNVIAAPYEYIGVMQAVTPLDMLDNQFSAIEAAGASMSATFKETIKNTFKEAQHPDRWRLSPYDINAIHGKHGIVSEEDDYYKGKFTEPFKETRPKAELNEWIDEKIKAGEDPTKDEIPVNNRVTAPVNASSENP